MMTMTVKRNSILFASCLFCAGILHSLAHEATDWIPEEYPQQSIYRPTPMPERITLTLNDNPATTQAVTWRTDTTVKHGFAEIAVANDNGRELKPHQVEAVTTFFESDINDAHYHTVEFKNLTPDTLYAYRVGDGVNWSEYFHFRTASDQPVPFSFIYVGDSQNEIKTHWSRVIREALRRSPYAAFTLHAGDLVSSSDKDYYWGEWHGATSWMNATIPVFASPGNHDYRRINQGPKNERQWTTRSGDVLKLDIQEEKILSGSSEVLTKLLATDSSGNTSFIVVNDDDEITEVGPGVEAMTGFSADDLLATDFEKEPLYDRLQNRGVPAVCSVWRPQFEFPVQNVPEGLEETCFYMDYQCARIISLDSNQQQEEQITWLRTVLENNPQRWTILTFHHPIFSPANDRDNRFLRELWKPLFDEFKVDLVLTGHDHTYSRTGEIDLSDVTNLPEGYQQAYDPEIGTVYVVSVSGPKMYDISKGTFAARTGQDTQLYQVIDVSWNELVLKAYTATGALYDVFTLKKRSGAPNELMEALPPENRRAPKSE